MKKIHFIRPYLLLLPTFMTICLSSNMAWSHNREERPEKSLHIMSYNIRVDTVADGINAWPHRKQKVANLIANFAKVDIAGIQEALRHQIEDLNKELNQVAPFQWWGEGRDGGTEQGEFSPIFYRKDRLVLQEGNTFWLSPTPHRQGSLGWDARFPRIVTWARFFDKNSGKTFYFFNTHFDHQGQAARRESAILLGKMVQSIAGTFPFIVTGDFNATQRSEVYSHLTNAQSPLSDARYLSTTGHQGPTASFVADSGWTRLQPRESRIDFIFVNKEVRNGVKVLAHRILDKKYQGRYPSDHLPVWARIEIQTE